MPNGSLTIEWDTTLQAIDQRHISEELCRDERSRRISLINQLSHLPDSEGFQIQRWLKGLPYEAVLESVVRRTKNVELQNGIKKENLSSYRLIIRLLSDEEVENIPGNLNLRHRRSIGSEVSIRNAGRPEAEDNLIGQPQLVLSKRDAAGGALPEFSLDRRTFVKVHKSHLEPATLDMYGLPWVWDHRDPDYILIKRWIPGYDQDILFEHTRLLRRRQDAKPTFVRIHRKHISRDTLDVCNLPWECDPHDSQYIIIKRWIDEEFLDLLFDHTRMMRARRGIGQKRPSDAPIPWNDMNSPRCLFDIPDSEIPGDDIADSLLSKCQTMEAAKQALEAAVRKRDAARAGKTGAGQARGVGGEERNESVDELLGRYTTLFDTMPSETATETTAPAVDGNIVEGEESKIEMEI
ncbi:MAG: hypothetical protein Q9187_009059 [Circinaria calcarea]